MSHGFEHEQYALKTEGYDAVIGVDEAGRGPLAGPLLVGAFCIFKWPSGGSDDSSENGEFSFADQFPWLDLTDSKVLREEMREAIFRHFEEHSNDRDGDTELVTRRGVYKVDEMRRMSESEETLSTEAEAESASSSVTASCGEKMCSINKKSESRVLEYFLAHSECSPSEIDRLNILEATLTHMARVAIKLCAQVARVLKVDSAGKKKKLKFKILIDGNKVPLIMDSHFRHVDKNVLECGDTHEHIIDRWRVSAADLRTIASDVERMDSEAIVKGDLKVKSIAAASIVAKVVRDRIMVELGSKYPDGFDLARNKGYPTPSHKEAVCSLGPSAIHRFSFAPTLKLLRTKKFEIPEGRSQEELDHILARLEARKGNGRKRMIQETTEGIATSAASASEKLTKFMRIAKNDDGCVQDAKMGVNECV